MCQGNLARSKLVSFWCGDFNSAPAHGIDKFTCVCVCMSVYVHACAYMHPRECVCEHCVRMFARTYDRSCEHCVHMSARTFDRSCEHCVRMGARTYDRSCLCVVMAVCATRRGRDRWRRGRERPEGQG